MNGMLKVIFTFQINSCVKESGCYFSYQTSSENVNVYICDTPHPRLTHCVLSTSSDKEVPLRVRFSCTYYSGEHTKARCKSLLSLRHPVFLSKHYRSRSNGRARHLLWVYCIRRVNTNPDDVKQPSCSMEVQVVELLLFTLCGALFYRRFSY